MAVFGMRGPMNNDRTPEEDAIAAILAGANGRPIDTYKWGATGGGTRMKPSDILANQKFQYDIAKDDLSRAQELNKRDALMNYYTSGGYRAGTDALMSGYDTMRGTSEAAINQQLADSLAGIGESYGTAQNLTEQGYGDLINYLSANQQDPYAQVRVQNTAPVQLEGAGYLQSQNALSPDVLAYQQAVSSAGQSGAEQYQNLLNVLSSLNQSGNRSRASEAQMGRNVALTGLGEQRAGYESGLRSSANQSLTQLATQIAQKKLEAEAQADAQAQSLLETLAGLGIDVTGLLNPQPVQQSVQAPTGPNMGLSQNVLDELARRRTGF